MSLGSLEYRTHIGGPALRAAVQRALEFLGESSLRTVLENMQQHGFRFEEEESIYTIQEVNIFLYGLFGEDASVLLIRRLNAALG